MRDGYSAYEAFWKWGFDDGEAEGLGELLREVAAILSAEGWRVTQVGGVHNPYFDTLVAPDGRVIDLVEAGVPFGDLEDVRAGLLRVAVRRLDKAAQGSRCHNENFRSAGSFSRLWEGFAERNRGERGNHAA